MLFFISFTFLVLSSAFFSSTETAFTILSFGEIVDLQKKKPFSGKILFFLKKNHDLLISAILISNSLINIIISTLASYLTIKYWGETFLGISTFIVVLIILTFCEMNPKYLALYYHKQLCLISAPILLLIYYICLPFSKTLNFIALFFLHKKKSQSLISIENIQTNLELARMTNLFHLYENILFNNILRINIKQLTIKDIITHRTQIFSLEENTLISKAYPQILKQSFSRIPLYRGDKENIVGLIEWKDFDKLRINPNTGSLKNIKKKAIFVPFSQKIYDTLAILHKENQKMLFILDEYGSLMGLATQEDVFGELIGQFYDENYKNEWIQKISTNTFTLYGQCPVHILEEEIKINITTHKRTINGFLSEIEGSIPKKDTIITLPWGKFTILSSDKRMIHKVLVQITNL